MKLTNTEQRYNAIKKRHFNHLLNLFIFYKLENDNNFKVLQKRSDIGDEMEKDFLTFSYSDYIEKFNDFLQNKKTAKNTVIHENIKSIFSSIGAEQNKVGSKIFRDLFEGYDNLNRIPKHKLYHPNMSRQLFIKSYSN